MKKGGGAAVPTLKGGDFPLRPLHPRKLNLSCPPSRRSAVRRNNGADIRHFAHLVPPDDNRVPGGPLDKAGKRGECDPFHTENGEGPLFNRKPRAG